MKKLFNKKAFALLLCLVLALTALLTVTAFADTAPADGTAAQTEEAADSGVSAKAIASGVAIGVAAAGGAIGMGMAIAKSAEGIARQPEASGQISKNLILGCALAEATAIYGFLIAILLIFMN